MTKKWSHYIGLYIPASWLLLYYAWLHDAWAATALCVDCCIGNWNKLRSSRIWWKIFTEFNDSIKHILRKLQRSSKWKVTVFITFILQINSHKDLDILLFFSLNCLFCFKEHFCFFHNLVILLSKELVRYDLQRFPVGPSNMSALTRVVQASATASKKILLSAANSSATCRSSGSVLKWRSTWYIIRLQPTA